jgi:predicted PurR-regulated permease PerM
VADTPERLLLIRERRFLLSLLLIAGLFVLYLVRGFVAWAVLGLLLGYICLPLQRRMERFIKSKEVAAIAVLVVAILIVVVPLGFLVWSVAGDISRIATSISDKGLDVFLAGILVKVVPPDTASSIAASAAQKIPDLLLSLAPTVLGAFVDATVGIFILASALLAVLTKGDEILVWLHRIVPLRKDREQAFFDGFQKALDAVIYGVIVVAAIQAVVGGAIWWLAGLPSVPFWTAIIFVFAMIPALGPSMVLLPGAVYAWITGNHTGAYILIAGTVVAIGVIDYVVRPQIIKRKGDLDPTLTLLSIVGGVTTMGIIGVFVGPLAVAIFLEVVELTMQTHAHFGGDYDSELFEPDDPIAGEPPMPPDANAKPGKAVAKSVATKGKSKKWAPPPADDAGPSEAS